MTIIQGLKASHALSEITSYILVILVHWAFKVQLIFMFFCFLSDNKLVFLSTWTQHMKLGSSYLPFVFMQRLSRTLIGSNISITKGIHWRTWKWCVCNPLHFTAPQLYSHKCNSKSWWKTNKQTYGKQIWNATIGYWYRGPPNCVYSCY